MEGAALQLCRLEGMAGAVHLHANQYLVHHVKMEMEGADLEVDVEGSLAVGMDDADFPTNFTERFHHSQHHSTRVTWLAVLASLFARLAKLVLILKKENVPSAGNVGIG